MKYEVDTQNKIIRFVENAIYSASDLKELIEKYPDYIFSQPLIQTHPLFAPFDPNQTFPTMPYVPIQYYGTEPNFNVTC